MRRKAISTACLALAGLILASAMAGCGQHPSAATGRLTTGPSSGQAPADRPSAASKRLAYQAGGSPAPGRSSAPRPAPTAPGPAVTSRGGDGSLLADGLYADAASNTARYVFALAHSGPAAVHGSVTFFHQDGRADTVARYTGRLSKDGRLTLVFSSGRRLAGTYRSGHLTLANCASVLTWAIHPSYCQFAYGDVP
jgi:hypothetical protein